MRITLDALLVLDAIDRCGSFAAGADELCRVPSAISHTIQKLEQDLGVVIFDRTGYRAKLTVAGKQVLHAGRDLLRSARQMEQKVREIGTGEARLAIGVSDLVPRSALYPLLSRFFESTANHATQVYISRESQATMLENLRTGRSDVVIGSIERADSISGVRTRVLGELQLALVMPSTHPLARVTEALSRQAILPYRTIRQRESLFDNVVELDSSNSIVVDDYASQVDAIRHGLGIGLVPWHLVRDDAEKGRLVVRVLHDAPSLSLTVAWRAADSGRPVQWILEHLRDEAILARLMPRIVRTTGIADLPVSAPIQPRVHDNGREVTSRVAAS